MFQAGEFVDSPVVGIERLARLFELEQGLFEQHPGPKFYLEYERLHASPRSEFERLLGFWLSAPIRPTEFTQALHLSSFRQMQGLEIEISRAGKAKDYLRLGVDNWSGNLNDLKVRAGKVGGFQEVLPRLADIDELAVRYPATARTLAARQSFRT